MALDCASSGECQQQKLEYPHQWKLPSENHIELPSPSLGAWIILFLYNVAKLDPPTDTEAEWISLTPSQKGRVIEVFQHIMGRSSYHALL